MSETIGKMRIFTAKYGDIMKRFLLILLVFTGIQVISSAQEHRRYALVWNDEFDSGELDKSVWAKTKRSQSSWAMHMTSNDALYGFEDGNLVLWGKVNDFLPNDTASVLTGGVWSRHRKAFGFGRVEVRAKFDVASGFWPAIWMLPETNQAINWPYGGEIDIMEHFMDRPHIDQTVHTRYTYLLRKRTRPPYVNYAPYREGEYNTYGVERFQDSLVFFVNGQRTFCYPRYRKGVDGQFPFSNYDYYLIIDAQLGGDASPHIDMTKLPVALRVDYVRYYELDTKTDVIPEPNDFQLLKNKRYKFRKVVVNKKEHFNHPDEYHIVVKRGKATISGNLQWAQSTLQQLVDENGYISNLEVRDYPACPYRGIALDEKNCRLTFEELAKMLDMMAFYKLNYLKWNGNGVCSTEEVNLLKEQARNLGITIIDDIPADVGLFMLGDNTQIPAMNRVFSKMALGKGGLLYLNAFGVDEMETLMAFAERYWRGGSAGAVEGGELSPAGTRLANFKERVAIHHRLYHQK